jgi:hypothetical protein
MYSNQELARATVTEHLTAARGRHLAAQARAERREQRRDRRRQQRRDRRLERRAGRRAAVTPTARPYVVPVPADHADRTATLLHSALGRVAEHVAVSGTATETRVLVAMSAACRSTSPGAAAALVDWDAAEITRLRAFGILHVAVFEALEPEDRAWLLDQILGPPDVALAG